VSRRASRAARAGLLSLALGALAGPALAQALVVNAPGGASLRDKPALEATVIGRVASGARLEQLGRSGEWYEVVDPATGAPAWIHSSLVRMEGDMPDASPVQPAPPAPVEDDRRPRAPRRAGSRLSAFVGGTLAAAGSGFEGQRRFTEFAEEGRIDADYARETGPGFELGLEYALGRHFGLAASFNLVSRAVSSTYTASLPHPLFLAQPRQAAGSADGLSYQERAFHFDLLFRSEQGRLRYAAFAGPSHVRVESDLLEPPQYRHAYPFDAVEVTAVPRASSRAGAFGFNVGAEVDYRIGTRLGAALLVRYHQVRSELPQTTEDVVKVDAGGLQVGLGLSIKIW
jgi:hypothetical protein